jgi:hypothetical protein
MRLTTICVLALTISSASTSRAAVIYDESVNGDLAPLTTGQTPLLFSPGSNVVTGNTGLTVTGTPPYPADWDSFAFTVSPSNQLFAASLSTVKTAGDLTQMQFSFTLAPLPTGSNDISNDVASSAQILAKFLPLGPGTYYITGCSLTCQDSGPSYADYTFDFEVQAVPEPAAMLLLLLGMFGVLTEHCRQYCSLLREKRS